MRKIIITGKGGGDRLEVVEAPLPEAGRGEVRIQVHAAGVNFADVMMRLGLYPDAPKLPAVPGYEVAGIVDQVGGGADPGLLGKPVVAMCNFGGYSEVISVPAPLVFPLPAGKDPVQAAAIPVNYLTAWQMVRVMARVAEGETVLIHSAGGGVGQAAVQLCQESGARIMGSASPEKHPQLHEQGLCAVIDSRQRGFAPMVREFTGGQGADVILEPRNGPWIGDSYDALAKCGRLVLFGFSHAAVGKKSGTLSALRTLAQIPWLRTNPIALMNDNKSVAGVNLGRMWDQGKRTGDWLREILSLWEQDKIAPRLDRVLPFSRAAEAHARLENRENFGKVLLVPDERYEE